MTSILLSAVMLFGGIDVGGRVGGAYPLSGLSRYHSSTALLGGHVGWSQSRTRFELGYNYASLPGIQGASSRLVLHQVMLTGAYRFAGAAEWGFEASLGGGYALGEHAYGRGSEEGGAAAAEIGLGFVQRAGSSRLSVGLANTTFIENGGSIGIALNHVFSIRAGVAYAP